jgi:hypothetical protein
VSIGGESHVNTGVGCYRNYDHAMSGGCVSNRKDSLGPPSTMPNPSATNLLDLSSMNNTINNDNQMTTTAPDFDSPDVSQTHINTLRLQLRKALHLNCAYFAIKLFSLFVFI